MSITDAVREATPGHAVKQPSADLGLSRLRSFICLAEELHFGRAAQRLHISQPALSQQIVRLEKDVATPLLRRTNRTVWLTPAGREFLRGARAAVRALDETTDATRRRAGSRLPLVLSHVPHADSGIGTFVEDFGAALAEQLFRTTVRIARHDREEHRRALHEGRAVLGICPADDEPQVRGLGSADIVVRAAPGHASATAPYRLRLSWPEWASPAEVDRLVSLAQDIAEGVPAPFAAARAHT
ncbi:LysR family transcriptional regulator [Streptomyces bohaiensis]|uniref:LysR family transcriptional regulator n=1 Tax=Streptomyces bohaiensis TaxID=1431344 RepID=A0ABX1C6Y4_9ACTN|nr:LysR family transcriptional regulator [Streptomyces bohaiensis]NJQ13818.1 LysR family transcriptional regulator [Streptomyces bohaiensis]